MYFDQMTSSRSSIDDECAVHPTITTISNDHVHHFCGKRKLNAYNSTDTESSEITTLSTQVCTCDSSNRFEKSSSSKSSNRSDIPRLNIFVRIISKRDTIVIQAEPRDTVESLREKILEKTSIPIFEQRLVYRGKQLETHRLISDYDIENDAELQLGGRMRSTRHPLTWGLIENMVRTIIKLCRFELDLTSGVSSVWKSMRYYIGMFPAQTEDSVAIEYLNIFSSSSAISGMVMMYASPSMIIRTCGGNSIKYFLYLSDGKPLSIGLLNRFTHLVLELSHMLMKYGHKDPLYLASRRALSLLFEKTYLSDMNSPTVMFHDVLPFTRQIVDQLCNDLMVSIDSVSPHNPGPSSADIVDLFTFLNPLTNIITQRQNQRDDFVTRYAHSVLLKLLMCMSYCLDNVTKHLRGTDGIFTVYLSVWSNYLTILKALYGISKLFRNSDDRFWRVFRESKEALWMLVIRNVKKEEDHSWVLEHKELTCSLVRRVLVMRMIPEVEEEEDDDDEFVEISEMIVDRSDLLEQSFEYITNSDVGMLRNGLYMVFDNEDAMGPGVLREWFWLVAQRLFNTEFGLFLACPSDPRRFYPNPACRIDPNHLKYYNFAGRIIGLAIKNNVQVGIVFDRIFFQQLCGQNLSLEDIKETDPCIHNSLIQLLEMDESLVDSGTLALTFSIEVEESGQMITKELIQGGTDVAVTSNNRSEFVNLFLRARFETCISHQVSAFAHGFADIVSSLAITKSFFKGLELKDLDFMLYGTESVVDVWSWKAITDYHGYSPFDPQIEWFWKIVQEMSEEKKRVLLCFWTAVKYLPAEGFMGFRSRLTINMSDEPYTHLPSSHTCFYQLAIPFYPSIEIMRDRLEVITREYVSYGFGYV